MMTKTALITGITGQDGSYLSELLLKKGYRVFGFVRRTSAPLYERIRHILDSITLLEGDITDSSSLLCAVRAAKPDEVYNLAAQSYVATSWKQPIYTADATALGTVRVLEAIRNTDTSIKFYQASSSEMFGNAGTSPQNEETLFRPRSPYGFSKVMAHHATVNYRESYGMFTCSGILFNHESPRRGIEFVTRKISHAVARIYHGRESELVLGDLCAQRDWGFAGDYVEAMWTMLQQKKPDDFVIATGKTHSVGDFCAEAFAAAGIDNWKKLVKTSKKFCRPAEIFQLIGDPSKARNTFGWKPKTDFAALVKMMVENDIAQMKDHHH